MPEGRLVPFADSLVFRPDRAYIWLVARRWR